MSIRLPKSRFPDGQTIRSFREQNRMNQTDFWSRVGTTQSGGSRYESGRDVPEPVEMLLNVVYGTKTHSQKYLEILRTWRQK